jgi:hypothetical protein
MSNRLVFDGLDSLARALQQLPGHLRDEAAPIIHGAATGALAEIKAQYPTGRRGRLRQGLKIALRTTDAGAAGIVTNTAPHAWIFENGTQARYVTTLPRGRAKNFGSRRGAMPPGRVFIPVVVRHRRAMLVALTDVVRREGFQVTGHAG